MARISEFEIVGGDQVEVAITQAEYDAMIANGSTYKVDLYYADGTVTNNNPGLEFTDWTFDADTSEWVSVQSVGSASQNNFNPNSLTAGSRYQGLGLYNDDGGTITGSQYLVVSNVDESAFASAPVDGPLAGTGVTLEFYDFGSLPNDSSSGQDSIRWDAQNPTSPFRSDPRLGDTGDAPTCYCNQTHILTPTGPVPIEELSVGDKVVSTTGNPAIRWIGKRYVSSSKLETNPNFRPVRITASALGPGFPSRDLLVSRQHRIALSSPIAETLLGHAMVLVPAHILTEFEGVFIDNSITKFFYIHLLFDHHEVIFAEGTPAESLYIGPQVQKLVSGHALSQIYSCVPNLAKPRQKFASGYQVLSNKQSRMIISNHLEERFPLIDPTTLRTAGGEKKHQKRDAAAEHPTTEGILQHVS